MIVSGDPTKVNTVLKIINNFNKIKNCNKLTKIFYKDSSLLSFIQNICSTSNYNKTFLEKIKYHRFFFPINVVAKFVQHQVWSNNNPAFLQDTNDQGLYDVVYV